VRSRRAGGRGPLDDLLHGSRHPIDSPDQLGDIDLSLVPNHGRLGRLFERVRSPEEEFHTLLRGRPLATSQQVQEILGAMGQLGHLRVAHGSGHAFDGVHGPEDPGDRFLRRGIPLPLEERSVEGGEMIPSLREEELGVLREVHALP
jgi:hypothetical protein